MGRRRMGRRVPRRNRRRGLRKNVKRVHTARNAVGHLFKRTAYQSNQIQLNSGSGTVFGSNTFALANLPGYTDFTELYDQYKINKVKVQFIPKITSAILNGSAQIPMIHSTIDSNDATPPASIQSMMENEDVKSTRGNAIHTRYFTPKCQTKLYESAVTDGYAVSRKNPFINTADPTVPHYALKWAIEGPVSGGEVYWYCDVKVTYYFACREVQ